MNDLSILEKFINETFPKPKIQENFLFFKDFIYREQLESNNEFYQKNIIPLLKECREEILKQTEPFIRILVRLESTIVKEIITVDDNKNIVEIKKIYPPTTQSIINQTNETIRIITENIQNRYIYTLKDRFHIK